MMLIDFNEIKEVAIPNMNDGEGKVMARMDVNDVGRFVQCTISAGCSIGPHIQESNHDINFIVSGEGLAICDGIEEDLKPGVCHVCPRGSSHSMVNTGSEDLVFFTVVPK